MAAREPLRPGDFETIADGAAAVRAPSDPSGSSAPSSEAPSDPMMTIELGADSPTLVDVPARKPPPIFGADDSVFPPGTVLGQRYEILQILGQGGMGAVYKALDREVNRTVALKVIRPDLARNSSIIERFKQELVLSHQVTHRNVVRIYDLGEADGVKFITMEYIEGSDLRSLIKERKAFPPGEAVEIMLQICRALEAAHSVGVIHRDLKPQNIMRDNQGRVVVMDFGLARLMESDGMTQTGALVGTMEYMSPEQALGSALDQRSDLFTLGLIFYELLSGKMPFHAESALASLIKRTQERAVAVTEHDKNIPAVLASIVTRCMERDPKLRYQNATELLNDLEAWQGKRAAATLNFPASQRPWGQTIPWHWVGGVAAALVLVTVGFLLRNSLRSAASSAPQASLAVLPFRNASGDSSLDWMGSTVAEILRTDMGQSASLRTIPSDRVDQILHDLRVEPSAAIDPETLRRVAEFTSADRLLSGQFTRLGGQIRIDATLQDLKSHRNFSLNAQAPSEKELPNALQHLAESVEKNMQLASDTIKDLQAKTLRPSSKSVQALRYYGEGIELSRTGKNLEAVKQFESATKEDPDFALAYSQLATSYAALGYGDKAQDLSRKAMDLSDGASTQEKYLIAAQNARITKDYNKAIESYEKLAAILQDDPDIQYALARLYEDSGAFDKAQADYEKILSRDPKNQNALLHMGWLQIRRNNAQASLDYLNRALALSVQLRNEDEKAVILDAIGSAYQALNQQEDAIGNYRQSLDIKRRLGNKPGEAETLNLMATSQEAAGRPNDALKTYEQSIALRRDVGDKAGLGRSLVDLGGLHESLGHYDEALSVTKEALPLLREIGDRQNEAMCLNNIGWYYLDKSDYENAMTYLQQGLQLRQQVGSPADVADSFYNIGETYFRMGDYSQATDDYLKALDTWRKSADKRGVAFASYGLGRIFQYQGRYGAALTSEQDALASWRDTNEHGFWLPEIEASYGNALSLVARWDDAQKSLDEALNAARELKNDTLVAQILNFEGDKSFYAGDARSAKALFQQASPAAAHSKNQEQILQSKFNLLKVDLPGRHGTDVINSLKAIAQESDRAGLKHLSLQCSTSLVAALIAAKDYAQAKQAANHNLDAADKLGLSALLATNHYLLGEALRLSGSQSESTHHYSEAHRILDDIRKEARSDDIMKRSDFAIIVKESGATQSASN